jgi:hypothetical protein
MEVPPLWSTIFFRQNNGKIEITRVISPSFSHLPLGNSQEKLSADSLFQLSKTLSFDADFSCAPALSLLPFAVDGRGKNKRRESDIIQLEEQVLARRFLQDNPTMRRNHLPGNAAFQNIVTKGVTPVFLLDGPSSLREWNYIKEQCLKLAKRGFERRIFALVRVEPDTTPENLLNFHGTQMFKKYKCQYMKAIHILREPLHLVPTNGGRPIGLGYFSKFAAIEMHVHADLDLTDPRIEFLDNEAPTCFPGGSLSDRPTTALRFLLSKQDPRVEWAGDQQNWAGGTSILKVRHLMDRTHACFTVNLPSKEEADKMVKMLQTDENSCFAPEWELFTQDQEVWTVFTNSKCSATELNESLRPHCTVDWLFPITHTHFRVKCNLTLQEMRDVLMKKNTQNRRCNSEARFFKISNDRGDIFQLVGSNNEITRFSRSPEIKQRAWTVQVSGLSLAFSKYKELAEALSVDAKLLETGQKSFLNGVMAVSFTTAEGAVIQALKLSPFRHILSRALTVTVSPETLLRPSIKTSTLLPAFMSIS